MHEERVDQMLAENGALLLWPSKLAKTASVKTEPAMRKVIRRRPHAALLARALKSSEEAKSTGAYYSATEVHAELQRRLDARRKQVLG